MCQFFAVIALVFVCHTINPHAQVIMHLPSSDLLSDENIKYWQGLDDYWSIQENLIVGTVTDSNTKDDPTYLIWDKKQVDNFKLSFQYKITGDGNSGMQYRSKVHQNYHVTGYQADFETGNNWTGLLVEMGDPHFHLAYRGERVKVTDHNQRDVYGTLGSPEELQTHIKSNDWNSFEIIANGNSIKHLVNGVTMTEVIDQRPLAPSKGFIAIQLNRNRPQQVLVKDIHLTPSSSSTSK